MGPNLTRLHYDAKQNLYHTQDGVNIIHSEVVDARTKLEELYLAHGEALIEALDEFNTWYGMKGWDARELELTDRISKLLAQLEAEAQP